MERWALQLAHHCWNRDVTEIHYATPHVDRISPLQVYRIDQETLLQYSPNTRVPALCSDIFRCRNSAPKSPNSANPPSFYSSPPITTFDYTHNFLGGDSRPV